MKLQPHPSVTAEDELLQVVLSANQYAKYQSQRTAYRRQYRTGRRPPKS